MDESHVGVLLIADDREDAGRIEALLHQSTQVPVSIERAYSMHEGHAALTDREFDLVLFDLTVPDCRGRDSLRATQAVAGDAVVAVLADSPSERIENAVVREGAQDLVAKDRMRARSMRMLVDLTAEHVQRRQAEEELAEKSEQLQLAEEVQQRLYPATAPDLAGFDIGGSVYPANHVCGDYFDFFDFGRRRLGIALGDVCGHGLGAALPMIEIRSYLRALAGRVVDPGELLAGMNELLVASPTPRFVTLMVAALDETSRILTYGAAGHQGYLINDRGETDILESTGMPLGCISRTPFPNAPPRRLRSGDIVLLPTDGVQETLSPDQDLFGTERMLDVVRDSRSRSAGEIIAELHAAARRFAQHDQQLDDIAAVVVRAE